MKRQKKKKTETPMVWPHHQNIRPCKDHPAWERRKEAEEKGERERGEKTTLENGLAIDNERSHEGS